jgi:hypothetical protein
MGFSSASDDAGRSRLVITDEPDYIVPLQIAPAALEDHLRHGKWLVVGMSVWSVHDRQAGLRAVKLVKRIEGVVKLGLRPVSFPEENVAWVPDYQPSEQSEILMADGDGKREVTIRQKSDSGPVWVAIAEGKVVRVIKGRLADADISALLSELCDLPG